MYKIVKRNYERGLWTTAMVATACAKGVISSAEYREITNEAYAGAVSAREQLDAAAAAMAEGVNSIDQ